MFTEALFILFHLFFVTTPRRMYYYFPCFSDEETELREVSESVQGHTVLTNLAFESSCPPAAEWPITPSHHRTALEFIQKGEQPSVFTFTRLSLNFPGAAERDRP